MDESIFSGDKRKLVAGLIMGAAIGALLGVLLAPAKGSVTRRSLRDKAGNLADDLKERFGKAGSEATGFEDPERDHPV